MQWLVKNPAGKGDGQQVQMPDAVVPGEAFAPKLAHVDAQVAWNRTLATLTLTGPDGVEANVRVRSRTLAAFEGEAATTFHCEYVAGSPRGVVSFTGTIEPWVPGQVGRGRAEAGKALHVRSQITGKVLKVLVSVGQAVQAGDTLLVVEAMKMENRIFAPQAGQIAAVLVKEGDSVATGKELVRLGNA